MRVKKRYLIPGLILLAILAGPRPNFPDFDGEEDPTVVLKHLLNPRSLVCDDEEKVVYYFQGKDLWKYNEDNNDFYENGKLRANLGQWNAFWFWEDALYTANDTTLY